MTEHSKSNAHIWVFSGLLLLALAVAFTGIIIYICTMCPFYYPWKSTVFEADRQTIGSEEEKIAALVEQNPALEAWFRFADAVVLYDLQAALDATCKAPSFSLPEPQKYDVNSLSTDELLTLFDDFDNTYEVILLRAGFVMNFRFVHDKAPEHCIVEVDWSLNSLNLLYDYYEQNNLLFPLEQAEAKRSRFMEALERAEEIQFFEFYKIDDKWYYQPLDW